ncbi:hypothetical protein I203_102057 [Kwoniella mangroviensis CBS 8507]|uniref:uncharacterized protein n=1 Tax=Kwoniella mangroviensis CBS 8507 TaxID=1296122 RepID=UPI00080CCB64|nr:uncharacterized protein I203_03252 [Kwoniella mangroviensis CBS 8507]OCF67555.1 hypothetical protein I203_03252 [Kwoniella mangroviensis CBS 8507]
MSNPYQTTRMDAATVPSNAPSISNRNRTFLGKCQFRPSGSSVNFTLIDALTSDKGPDVRLAEHSPSTSDPETHSGLWSEGNLIVDVSSDIIQSRDGSTEVTSYQGKPWITLPLSGTMYTIRNGKEVPVGKAVMSASIIPKRTLVAGTDIAPGLYWFHSEGLERGIKGLEIYDRKAITRELSVSSSWYAYSESYSDRKEGVRYVSSRDRPVDLAGLISGTLEYRMMDAKDAKSMDKEDWDHYDVDLDFEVREQIVNRVI